MTISRADYDPMQARLAARRAQSQAPTPVSREDKLHDSILAECRSRGWLCFHGSMAHRAHRTVGEPDFLILGDGGRLFVVEAKTKSGKLSVEQAGLMAWATHLGHKCAIVRSFEEFLRFVEAP